MRAPPRDLPRVRGRARRAGAAARPAVARRRGREGGHRAAVARVRGAAARRLRARQRTRRGAGARGGARRAAAGLRPAPSARRRRAAALVGVQLAGEDQPAPATRSPSRTSAPAGRRREGRRREQRRGHAREAVDPRPPARQDAVYEVLCDAEKWTATAGTFRTDARGHAYVIVTTAMRRGEYNAIRIVRRGTARTARSQARRPDREAVLNPCAGGVPPRRPSTCDVSLGSSPCCSRQRAAGGGLRGRRRRGGGGGGGHGGGGGGGEALTLTADPGGAISWEPGRAVRARPGKRHHQARQRVRHSARRRGRGQRRRGGERDGHRRRDGARRSTSSPASTRSTARSATTASRAWRARSPSSERSAATRAPGRPPSQTAGGARSEVLEGDHSGSGPVSRTRHSRERAVRPVEAVGDQRR